MSPDNIICSTCSAIADGQFRNMSFDCYESAEVTMNCINVVRYCRGAIRKMSFGCYDSAPAGTLNCICSTQLPMGSSGRCLLTVMIVLRAQ